MARGRKSALRIVLSPEERQALERWQRSTTMAAGLVRRGRLLRRLADGYAHSQVARLVPVQRTVVRKWARRFLAPRLEGLSDAPGRGAKGGFSPRRRDARGTLGLRTARHLGP
jgi:hypothetical protein